MKDKKGRNENTMEEAGDRHNVSGRQILKLIVEEGDGHTILIVEEGGSHIIVAAGYYDRSRT